MMSDTSRREMPFLDHLEELRARLFWIGGSLVAGFAVGLVLHHYFDLVTLLKWPACPYLGDGCVLQVFSPSDRIAIPFTIALWVGVILASPVILYQIWAFVSPALYPRERRVGAYVLAGGLLLFCLGVALAHLFVLPATLRFAAEIGGPSLIGNYAARDYFSLVVTLAVTFGLAFELPIVIVALTALGLVTPSFLRRYWRQALILCLIAAAVISPGDAIYTTIFLVAPLYALYEFGIVLSRRAYRWREQTGRALALGAIGLVRYVRAKNSAPVPTAPRGVAAANGGSFL
jgi:sec-independent protein translocase protein TatC